MERMGTNGPLLPILLLALVLRAAVAALLPSIVHPDETFQYLEQAYRVVAGRGMVPWEYVVGVRSWVIPGLLIPLAAAGHWLSPQPDLYLGGVCALMIGLSLTSVAAVWFIAKVHSGNNRIGAVLAALLMAVWPETVMFAPHVLADTLSGATLIAGLACATPRGRAGRRRVVATGLLLGLTVALRIQLGPAVAVAVLALAPFRFRAHLIAFGLALAAPLLAFGLVDWATWGAPFHSTLANLRANAGGVADTFGVEPWSWYLTGEWNRWDAPVAVLIAATAALGALRAPLPASVLTVIVVTFSAVAHKEYRFLYPALPILLCLSGIGTASAAGYLLRLMRWTGDRVASRWDSPAVRLAVFAALAWVAAAAWVSVRRPMLMSWMQDDGAVHALAAINQDPKSCGVAVDPPGAWGSVAFSRLRADLSLYAAPTDDVPSSPSAYNYVFQPWDYDPDALPDDYTLVRCFGEKRTCIYRREGPCSPPAGQPLPPGTVSSIERAVQRTGLKPVVDLTANPYAWRPRAVR